MGELEKSYKRHPSGEWFFVMAFLILSFMTYYFYGSPSFRESSMRRTVSHVQSDMRAEAIAIEAYYSDQKRYPVWSSNFDENNFNQRGIDAKFFQGQSTFIAPGLGFATLTSPVEYIKSFPRDSFTDSVFSYYSDPQSEGWILWSPGPDKHFDVDLNMVQKIYDPSIDIPSDQQLLYTYDPSNGTTSAGDIFRVCRHTALSSDGPVDSEIKG